MTEGRTDKQAGTSVHFNLVFDCVAIHLGPLKFLILYNMFARALTFL